MFRTKCCLMLLGVALLSLSLAVPAMAADVSFQPNPADLFDLDHSYAYAWGVNYNLPANEYVDFASISFNQINNWQNEPNILYVSLLNDATAGVGAYWDSQASGNFFAGSGTELFTYSDADAAVPVNLTYNFNGAQLTALNSALANGNVGFGFDPDCHFYNDGVEFKFTTKVVPEPISGLLFVVGAGVFGVVRKVRRG